MDFFSFSLVQSLWYFALGMAMSVPAVSYFFSIGRRTRGMPPGPSTLPIIGNEHQIPATGVHFRMTKWAKEYGGIFSLKRFMNNTLVITDGQLVRDLVDKKSNIYSHRPVSLVAHLITHDSHLLVMQYGERWRHIRKLIHQYFMESNCEKKHWKVQEAEAIQMLHDFLEAPQNHMMHPKRYSNSIICSLLFGFRTKSLENEYMNRLYTIMEKWSQVLEVGATPPVDSFPLLRILPQRFLGNWRNRALECGSLMRSLYPEVIGRVEERRLRGVHKDTFIDHVLDQQEKNPLTRDELLFLGGGLMEAGSDTSAALILTIIQAMINYPQVQARAHAEIDAVLGHDRSPSWSDFSKLPYINMIIKEAQRWRPVTPLGFPHALAQDDQVNGMHLPKGSTVILNIWGMHHDPQRWKEPETFQPERYEAFPALASAYTTAAEWDKRDHLGYGAGRRICAGIHLGERNLFIGVAKLLWAFEFTATPGSSNKSSAETDSSQGFLHGPKDYGCDVKLRSPLKRDTITRELAEAQTVFDQFD